WGWGGGGACRAGPASTSRAIAFGSPRSEATTDPAGPSRAVGSSPRRSRSKASSDPNGPAPSGPLLTSSIGGTGLSPATRARARSASAPTILRAGAVNRPGAPLVFGGAEAPGPLAASTIRAQGAATEGSQWPPDSPASP